MRTAFWILCIMQIADVTAAEERYRIFSDEPSVFGREVWLNHCEACHGWGVADAPIPMQADAWRNRLNKPREVLYQHALEGFFGPDDSMMPARGGNPELSDEEVRAAVNYMVRLAQYHIGQAD